MPVVMGRKTFESIGKAINREKKYCDHQKTDGKLKEWLLSKTLMLLFACKGNELKEIIVIGGGEIYRSHLKGPIEFI